MAVNPTNSTQKSEPGYNAGLHWFAVITALATLGLVGMGGLVTSHGVGMAVPDWPTSYGYNMFALPISTWLTGGIFHEHTHRLWASEVGILTVVMLCWMYGQKSRLMLRITGVVLVVAALGGLHRPNGLQSGIHIGIHGVIILLATLKWPVGNGVSSTVRKLGIAALVAVLLQGLLGGLRVVLDAHVVSDVRLGTAFGIVHGCLGQGFLVLTMVIALMTSRWWITSRSGSAVPREVARWFLVATLLISAQLLIAATMRHQHAGLAIPDFPLAYGKLWPDMSAAAVQGYNLNRVELTVANPITAFQIGLQMAHRIVAVLIAITVIVCVVKARRLRSLSGLATLWLFLILVQISLGAWTIWSNKAADVATAHVVVGALSLVTGAVSCLICFRRLFGTAQSPAVSISETVIANRASA